MNKSETSSTPPTARQSSGRIFRNARTLISGKAFGGVLSLAYLAIAARSLGPTQMGYLVLAHAYVLLMVGIARFQSWQAIIRFGAPMIETGDTGAFKTLVRFTTKIDLLSAVFSIGVALIFIRPVARLMEWPEEAMGLIYVYCFASPFLMGATPSGILRLFDQFKTLGLQLIIMPGVRFVGALVLWALDGGLTGFLIVWIASAVLHGASLWVLGWISLRQKDLLPAARPKAGDRAPRNWLPFMIKTNLVSTIDVAQNNLPVLLVGAVLGGAASGFLQLATNLSNLIAHPTNMLNEATFPELSKVAAAQGKKAMRSVAFRSAATGMAFAAPIVLVYVLFRKQLAVIAGGPEFAAAAILVALMAFVQIWRVASVVLQSAVVAIGRAGFVLGSQAVSAVINISLMAVLLNTIGVAGAPVAIMASSLALILLYAFALSVRRAGVSTSPPAGPPAAPPAG